MSLPSSYNDPSHQHDSLALDPSRQPSLPLFNHQPVLPTASSSRRAAAGAVPPPQSPARHSPHVPAAAAAAAAPSTLPFAHPHTPSALASPRQGYPKSPPTAASAYIPASSPRGSRPGSMSSALPYTLPLTASGRGTDDMMAPPQPPAHSSLGSIARSASLGRRKDPYAYSSDDVESGLGSIDMGAGDAWSGYSGTRPPAAAQQHHHPPGPPAPHAGRDRDVAMSPSRPASNSQMHPPPVPPHALSRPPPQGRYEPGGAHAGHSHRESISNPYIPRGSDPGPSVSPLHAGSQWIDQRIPPQGARLPSTGSYNDHSPSSDHIPSSSPFLHPNALGTSPHSPLSNAYDASPKLASFNLPASPGAQARWSATTQGSLSPAYFSRSLSNQGYAASQPATPVKAYDTGPPRVPHNKPASRAGFRELRDKSDLRPSLSASSYGRRADPDAPGKFLSPLKCLTAALPQTYSLCSSEFRYESSDNPRRVLTKPCKPVHNDGADNEDWDYILFVNDVLGGEGGQDRFLILDVLGQGTFGQVVKCQNMRTHDIVAVKVVKNKPAYLNQSKMEVAILELLNREYDPDDTHHILRMLHSFTHKSHLCLVFECLSSNLYELIKQNQFKGLSTQLVKVFTQQLLDCLAVLKEARLIHCDLKPENILLKSLQSPQIKVIDFGSACHEMQTVYTYIQSRFYRSPEVLLGLPYSTSIDMWSLGCIIVELFLGLPIFPGTSEYNQVSRIVDMLGNPPTHLLEVGKQTHEFFNYTGVDAFGKKQYVLKPMEQYASEHRTKEQPSKKYFKQTKLKDIIMEYPYSKKNAKQSDIDKEMATRRAFVDFVSGLLNLDPIQRWSPQQAAKHPFITGEKFTGPFQPTAVAAPTKKATAPQPEPSTTRQSPSSKKYGGLVQSPGSSRGQRVYSDAAAYNQQLNHHQAYTAQVAAAANAPRIAPFAPGYEIQQQQQQQSPYHARVPSQSHQPRPPAQNQWQHLPPPQPNFGQARAPSHTLSNSMSHAPSRGGQAMGPGLSNPPPNSYYPSSRTRANTINQMDAIPPALARLTHFGVPDPSGTRNLTPVLHRDEAMQEWERRQAGHSKQSSMSYPQLEYLQEQAELQAMGGGQGWMLPGPYGPAGGGPRQGHSQSQSIGGYQMQPGIGHSPQHATSGYDRRVGSEYDPPLPTSTSSRSYLPTYPPPAATSTPNSASFDGFDTRDPSMGIMYTPLQPGQAAYAGYGHPPAGGQLGHGHRASYSGPFHHGQGQGNNNPFAGQAPTSPRFRGRSQGGGYGV